MPAQPVVPQKDEQNTMNMFLTLAFLFFIGSVSGWILEVLFRRFISTENPERKWINPGFCKGPYVPLYGFGLCILYSLASLEKHAVFANPVLNRVVLFLLMAVAMTAIEYIAGIVSLKYSHVRLWDYSGEWGNIQGVICPKFSLIWSACGAIYYFFVHKRILSALDWLSHNLAFSFVIGLFFGVFILDVVQSAQLVSRLKAYAVENDVIVRYEALKLHIRSAQDQNKKKYRFFAPFASDRPIKEHLKELRTSLESHKHPRKTRSSTPKR